MQDDWLAFIAGIFYVRIFGSTIKILVSVYPRRSALMRLLAFPDRCELAAGQARILFYYYVTYISGFQYSYAKLLRTSIHETDIRSFNSNALRVYNPVTGIRHRKASTTSEIRQKICSYILNTFPNVRRIKIVDTGKNFSARVWFKSGRTFCEKAYSIRNLYGILNDKIKFISEQ